jgi:hypothetical protein
MLPDDALLESLTLPGLSFEEAHRIRHYAGLVALHLGLVVRAITIGDIWYAARNQRMVDEAFRLAVRG